VSRPPEDARGRRRTARDDEPTSGERATRRDWSDGGPSFVGDDPGFARRRSARRAGRGRGRRRLVGYTLLAVFAFIVGWASGMREVLRFFIRRHGPRSHGDHPAWGDLDTIAGKLEAEGVVRHARAFVIRVESDGHATDLKPGTYRLHENEPYARLVAMLVQGSSRRPSRSRSRRARLCARRRRWSPAGWPGSQHTVCEGGARRPAGVQVAGVQTGDDAGRHALPGNVRGPAGSSAAAFVDQQLTAFRDNFATVDMTGLSRRISRPTTWSRSRP